MERNLYKLVDEAVDILQQNIFMSEISFTCSKRLLATQQDVMDLTDHASKQMRCIVGFEVINRTRIRVNIEKVIKGVFGDEF